MVQRAPDKLHPAEQYAEDALAGRVVVGRLVRRAIERHLHDLDHGAERGLYFDPAAAQHAIDFFGFLRHSKGEWAGQPFELAPWQQFLVWVLFGWRRADGARRFRTAYVSVARKNGKSTLTSGVGLYLTVADGEGGAEVYAAATKKDQSRIVFEEAKRMVLKSPELRKRLEILKDNMHVEATASKFEPLSSDSDSLDGLNVHGAIIDELHAHKTRDLFDVIETATGARRQPLLFCITTAGFNQMGICFELRGYGQQVVDGFDKPGGVVDDTFFYVDYTIDETDDWREPACWIKANPNLGVSVKEDDLARKAEKAKRIATAQNNFRTKHLDEWRQQAVLWLPMDRWDACAKPVDHHALKKKVCYAGLDLSKTRDTTAFVLVFPREDGYDVLPYFWIPEEKAAEREKQDRVQYRLWAAQGLIEITPGATIEPRRIRAKIKQLGQLYRIREIGYDPWNATDTAIELGENDGFKMVEMRQGYATLSAPCKELENLVIEGKLAHGGHAVLRWHASNVSVKDDGNENIRPIKPNHQDPKKIDGIVALVMGLGRAIVHPAHQSVYATRGIRTL